MGDISAAKRHPPNTSISARSGHTLAGGTNICIWEQSGLAVIYGCQGSPGTPASGGLHGGSMAIPWGSLEEPMVESKLQVLLGTLTVLGISQSELIPAVGL